MEKLPHMDETSLCTRLPYVSLLFHPHIAFSTSLFVIAIMHGGNMWVEKSILGLKVKNQHLFLA